MLPALLYSSPRPMPATSTVCCCLLTEASLPKTGSVKRRDFLKRAACLTAAANFASHAEAYQSRRPATGPLKVHPSNPRYFADAGGNVVYLAGAHTWANLQDTGVAPEPIFDWEAYLVMMLTNNHNFMR